MPYVRITTRTLPPTETKDKRVRVRSENGTEADYPWDHRYDTDAMHENAARKLTMMEHPNRPITMYVVETTDMGYVFRAAVGMEAR